MKTLYVNINGENIQSTNEIIIVGKPEDAIINKFYFELGKEILRGIISSGISNIKKKDIVTEFKSHDEVAFGKILDQWECIKSILLGENPIGKYKIELPFEYVGWLQNNSQSSYAEIAKTLYQRGRTIEISIDKIYINTIGIIINNIDSNDCKQFVVNDNAVTDDSAISLAIQKRINNIVFVPFENYNVKKECNFSKCNIDPRKHTQSIVEDCLFALALNDNKKGLTFELYNNRNEKVDDLKYYRVEYDDAFNHSKYYSRNSLNHIRLHLYPNHPCFSKIHKPLLGFCPSDNTIRLMTKKGSLIICQHKGGVYVEDRGYMNCGTFEIIIDYPFFTVNSSLFYYDGKQIVSCENVKGRIHMYIDTMSYWNSITMRYSQVKYGKLLYWPQNKEHGGCDLFYDDIEKEKQIVKHFDFVIEEAVMFSINRVLLFVKKNGCYRFELIDLKGKHILPPQDYSRYEKLSEDYFKAMDVNSKKWGVFDMDGNTIIAPKYDGIAILDY